MSKSKQINPYHSKELKMVNFVKSRPIILRCDDVETGTKYFNGEDYIDADEVGNSYSFKGTYTEVRCPLCDGVKDKPHKNAKECYDCFVETNEELKALTSKCRANKQKIDLSKCGTFSHTFFHMMSEYHCDPLYNKELMEKIKTFEFPTYKEYQWMAKTSAQLLYCDKDYEGEIIAYDKNCYYASVMSDACFKIPIREGIEIQIKTLEEAIINNNKKVKQFKYGLYRCKILGSSIKNIIDCALFKVNPHNIYTHIDLQTASKLDYEMELIIDEDKPNFLYYKEEDLMNGNELFGELINHLYQLRLNAESSNAKKFIKNIISSGWGMLSQVETKNIHYTLGDDVDIPKGYVIYSDTCQPFDITQRTMKIMSIDKPYKTRYARIKPFLFSYTRNFLAREIMPYREDVVRIHTDGIYVKKSCDYKIETGKGLGQWKIELDNVYINIENVNLIHKYYIFDNEESIIIPDGYKIDKEGIKQYKDDKIIVGFKKKKNKKV